MTDRGFDAIIIGGGPAGLTAGIYASRAGMRALLIEKGLCGGQALITDLVENFPGFPDGVSGPDLADYFLRQAKKTGLEIREAEAKKLIVEKDVFKVIIDSQKELKTRSFIIATGASWNSLGVPGEAEFRGKGVSYCATCDGPLFKGKKVVVAGGGDTAVGEAVFLTKFAKKVTIVHRRDKLRAVKILQERALANKKIEIAWNSVITDIRGASKVEAVALKNTKNAKESSLACDGVFVLVGIRPNSEIVKGIAALDEKGYIIVDDDMKASVEGIFACGDVRKKALRQIVTACGDGATAASSAQHYLETHQ